MTEKEFCEECKKEITKELKEKQGVIFASAEHTLDGEDFSFRDPMFGGVYCSHDCFNEQNGVNIAYKKGKSDMKKQVHLIFIKALQDNEHKFRCGLPEREIAIGEIKRIRDEVEKLGEI